MTRSSLGALAFLLCVGLATPGMSAIAASSTTTSKQTASAKKTSTKKPAAKPASKQKATTKKAVAKKAVRSKSSPQRKSSKAVKKSVAAGAAAGAVMTVGDRAGLGRVRDELDLASNVALVIDQQTSTVLFAKNSTAVLPIASLTKLMTGLVVLEAGLDMDEMLTITTDDIDRLKGTGSRLHIGARLSRGEMMHIALMSSENRAASALGRHYPGGLGAFVDAMNRKARELGMTDSYFVEPTGLSSENVSSARDLAKLVMAAYQYPELREYSTGNEAAVLPGKRVLQYRNSNILIGNPEWDIGLQKTGYIAEAGRCLVMQAVIEGRPVVMVFLDSKGKLSRIGDAGRIRKWLESTKFSVMSSAPPGLSG